jgi:hypothetical protein
MSKLKMVCDVEVYQNYFLAMFTNREGRSKKFEIFNGDTSQFDAEALYNLLTDAGVQTITFNGNNYDIPILSYAMTDPRTEAIKKASDRIITKNLRSYQFYQDEGLEPPEMDHVDLIEVAPGFDSLKIYGGRLNSPRLQDLPLEPSAIIREDQLELMRKYCKNDTMVTWMLHDSLSGQLELRKTMSEKYGVDLRSKSDAQIAEAVLKSEYVRLTKSTPKKVSIDYDRFKYEPPTYVKFKTDQLQEVLQIVRDADMVIDPKTGHVKMPKVIEKLTIEIGQSRYKIGLGGLHSQESEVFHLSDEENVLIDRDVESYYPRMMLNMNMQPGAFGEHFNTVYGKILEERLAAKHAGNKVESDSLKIVLNGTFGKTSNKYSLLYSPEFMVRTTITGQLTVLMLIEVLELFGIPVVSANTDGIVIKCPRDKRDDLNAIIERWEKHTGLKTEEAVYEALYSRDVNNYIAVKSDGSVKTKGVFGKVSLTKNPQTPICTEAVVTQLSKGVPLERTVLGCRDITKFLTLRAVTGGAVKDGVILGKAVRWYYAIGETGAIHYKTNGNTVARSLGAKPVMDLPDTFPKDIDYDWYLRECDDILMSLGVKPRPVVEKLPRKNSNAWKALRDNGDIVEVGGKWVWADKGGTE